MFLKFQSNESTPGGSKQGNMAARKTKVIGVVFHINLSINPQIRQDKEKEKKNWSLLMQIHFWTSTRVGE